MKNKHIVEKGQRSLTVTAYTVTVFFMIAALIPMLWMFSSSLKTEADIRSYPPKWLPSIPRSVQVTLDYTGMSPEEALFYERDAMTATWFPWMSNLREKIGEVVVTGVRDGKLLYRAKTNSASFRVGQPLVVPSTLYNDTMINLKLPVIHERKLSAFTWYGDNGKQAKTAAEISAEGIADKFNQFYSTTSFVKGKVASVQEPAAWGRMFDSYRSLNKLAMDVSGKLGFFLYFANSAIVTLSTVAVQLVFGGMAGYALSHLIRSKKWQFLWLMFFLATIMIPGISLLLPLFLLMKELHLVNTLMALILPHAAWGMVIFLFKGFFDQLSHELVQAASIDGASEFRIFTQIVVPMSIPIFTVVAVMTFIPVWNEFVWPLVVNNMPEKWTFTVALNDLQSKGNVQQNTIMASSLVSMLPLLVVFLFSQKYIEKGIAFTGVKG